MGDEDDRSREVGQSGLEPLAGGEVEVVRRLVEAEERGGSRQHPRERQTCLLAPREHADLPVDRVTREEEGPEDRAEPRPIRLRRRLLDLLEDRVVGVELVELMLGVVLDGDVGAERALPALDREHPGQDAEQRRLPGPVGAHQHHAVAALHLEVDPRVDHVVAERLVDATEGDDAPAGSGRRREGEPDLPSRSIEGDALDPLEQLDAALRLARLGRLVAEALDEALDLGDAPGLVLGLRRAQRAARLPLDEVVVVVARVHRDAVGPELHDRRHHPIEEVAVVRDDDHGAVVRRQVALEPGERLEVEVVRRLVEQEERRAQEEQPRERGAHAPPPGQLGERSRELLLPEAEAAEDHPGRGLEAIAAERLEGVLEVAVPRGQRVARRRRQRPGDLFHLALDRPHLGEPAEGLGQHRAGRDRGGLLRQVADRGLSRPAHAPGVGRLQLREDPAERRLPHAVRPDEADPLALADLPGEVPEEDTGAVRLRDAFELDHDQGDGTPSSAASAAARAT